ncbi:hypothetical protein L1049_018751 [Liquidambar formosana]|uniref:Myb-related protein 123 n=1 Tax=Liquidambar formosana TaxID=63359 RepID=A0AAP0WMN4_LIQFO
MGRNPCCSKEGLNRGAWTALEDKILTDYIKTHGEGKWRNIPKVAGLKRCGKSCRLRWLNYLRPDIKRGNISLDEEDLIIRLHKLLGNRWSLIAGRLPGRTDNEIKNYWNTNLSKKAQGKESSQPKIERKPMMIRPPPPDETSPESSGVVKVVKANAPRCTSGANNVTTTPKAEYNDTNVATGHGPSMECDNSVKNVAAESESSDGSSMLVTCNDQILSDFSMDFNVGEICLSEILDPDFTNLGHDFDINEFDNVTENDGTNNGRNSELSPFSGRELSENWRGMDSDFRSLATFFESADQWLGDDLDIVYPS